MHERIVSGHYFGYVNRVCEWSLIASKSPANPFRDVELDIVIAHADGSTWRARVLGGRAEWRVRFAPPRSGEYTWISECSDALDEGLHGRAGGLTVSDEDGPSRTAALRVAGDGRNFETETGEPFFWLADTWWLGLSKRLHWPEEFQELAADRIAKGFNVIQIVAGLYPDMDWRDERGVNEAGFPYDAAFEQVNPAYFDMADLRIRHLVSQGLTPMIVGMWGFYFKKMGLEAAKRHWRYLVARWSAYPVVWCVAGEACMPFYLSNTWPEDIELQRTIATEVARYLRSIDPMRRLVTVHPLNEGHGRGQVNDASLLDFDTFQGDHIGTNSIKRSVRLMRAACSRAPRIPVINAEVAYEGHRHGNTDEVVRNIFWSSVLSGGAGYSYGAAGLWQFNQPGNLYGQSPQGWTYDDTTWREAMSLPGSHDLGTAKMLIERHRWWLFEPHQEWVSPGADESDYLNPYAAGIPGEIRFISIPRTFLQLCLFVCEIEPDVRYTAAFVNPSTGEEHSLGIIKPDAERKWRVPYPPSMRDWLLVLDAK